MGLQTNHMTGQFLLPRHLIQINQFWNIESNSAERVILESQATFRFSLDAAVQCGMLIRTILKLSKGVRAGMFFLLHH